MAGHDTRKFLVDIADDDARLWRALQAVEEGGYHAGQQYNRKVYANIKVEHDTGKYRRDYVAEAKAVAERNGFHPRYVRLEMSWLEASDDYPDEWIDATGWTSAELTVQVFSGTEVEVNGVFTMLQEAVRSALDVADDGEAAPVIELPHWQRLLRTVTTHPLIVAVVGGVIVLTIGTWLGLG